MDIAVSALVAVFACALAGLSAWSANLALSLGKLTSIAIVQQRTSGEGAIADSVELR
jgi:hypothetical protein